ncbi:hypothetical protein QBC39DRAFT_336604 [Podospora conica]|nr:hypothetical protein QBC39DRAFT_336604 [Schizothecium conicum]
MRLTTPPFSHSVTFACLALFLLRPPPGAWAHGCLCVCSCPHESLSSFLRPHVLPVSRRRSCKLSGRSSGGGGRKDAEKKTNSWPPPRRRSFRQTDLPSKRVHGWACLARAMRQSR